MASNDGEPLMLNRTIGQVAKEAGVGVETIRFYERQGLIPRPEIPVDGGFREYPDEIVDKVRFIRHAKDLGFTLQESGELLSLQINPSSNCGAVHKRVEAKLADVEAKIRTLRKLRKALQTLAVACATRETTADCPVLEALH